jgi:streptogramin lyase
MKRAWFGLVLAAAVPGCGDSTAGTESASATDSGVGTTVVSASNTEPTTDPVPTTSSASASESATTAGSNSMSDTATTGTSVATTDVSGTSTTVDPGTTAGTTMGVDPDTTNTTGPVPDLGNPCAGPGEPDVSYIWIANSDQGTISKINTQTLKEEGRYIVRPDQAGSPSRTSVNLTGDVAVANRNGGVAKVYAREESCVESNGMPGIQTSKDANFLPWGQDECVAWFTPMQYTSQRPVAWTQGTFNEDSCGWENSKLWTSGNNLQNGTVDVLRLDGQTGAIEDKVEVMGVGADYYGLYGAAVDAKGNMWASQLSQQSLVFVDGQTLQYKVWPMQIAGYGMTVDSKGYVWICSYAGAARFDPMTETWQTAAVAGSGGCMEDGAGTLYMSAGQGGVIALDTETLAQKNLYPLPEYVHGISIDYYGYVWGVSIGANAYRVDIMNNGAFDTFTGLVGAYTYSDMTGVALANVSPQ